MAYSDSLPQRTEHFGPENYISFLDTVPAPNFDRLKRNEAIHARGLVTRLGHLLEQLGQETSVEADGDEQAADDQATPDTPAAKTRAAIDKLVASIVRLTDRSHGTLTLEEAQEERMSETQKLPWRDRINLSINAAICALEQEIQARKESSTLLVSNATRRSQIVICDVAIAGKHSQLPIKDQRKVVQEQYPMGTRLKLITIRPGEEPKVERAATGGFEWEPVTAPDEEEDRPGKKYREVREALPKTSVVLAEVKSVSIGEGADGEPVLKLQLTLVEKGPVYTDEKKGDEAHIIPPDLTKVPKKYLELMTEDSEGQSTVHLPEEVLLSGKFPKPKPVTETRKDLDPSQNESYGMAMNMEPVVVIHGPPGAGKTTTLCAIIEDHIKKGRRVLGVSGSNKAVNVPALMLKKRGIASFRAGNNLKQIDEALHRSRITRGVAFPSKKMAEIREHQPSAQELRTAFGGAKGIKDDLRKVAMDGYHAKKAESYGRVKKAIEGGGVVFSTFGTLIEDDDLRALEFDVVIIDEATKARWPEYFDALKRAGKQIILVGDHRQLGPIDLTPTQRVNYEGALAKDILGEETRDFTCEPEAKIGRITRARVAKVYGPIERKAIHSDGAKTERFDQAKTLARLGVSMYEAGPLTSIIEGCRNPKEELPYAFLENNRRSLPNIVKVLSHLIYRDQLRPGRVAPEGGHDGIVQWIDTSKIETHESTVGTSRRNAKEADVVVNGVFDKLLNPDKSKRVAPEDIAVIATYAEQAALIRRKLQRKLHNNPELFDRIKKNVASVDSFQGDERKVVFVSMTRSNQAGSIGYLEEERRIGVAIGRAQDELYIIGDATTLVNNNSNPESQRFFQKMKHAVTTWGEMKTEARLTHGQRRAKLMRERAEHGLPNAPRRRKNAETIIREVRALAEQATFHQGLSGDPASLEAETLGEALGIPSEEDTPVN